jgi:hypothetical protein
MDQPRHAIIRSTHDDDTEALALIDGLVAARIERQQVRIDVGPLSAALTDASVSLSLAATLHQSGAHRDGFKWAIRAAVDLFRSIGASPEQIEPYRHLLSALDDLERGSLDPALKGPKISNRKITDSSEWTARACLALALELRMRWGESEELASANISRAIEIVPPPERVSQDGHRARLRHWRQVFQKGRVPEGTFRHMFAVAIARLDAANVGQGDDALVIAAENMLDLARRYRARVGFKLGG